MSETKLVTFRGGCAFDDGKQRRLHITKCDGKPFITQGGSVMGDDVPPRVHVFRDGEAHFVRWATDEDFKAGEIKLECHICKAPAACHGTYEGITGYSCDDCCGHGCEDGHCELLEESGDE